jgi:multicomponent Na+:H+ antiporter subunit F
MIDPPTILLYSIQITMAFLCVSLILVGYRILRGPSLPDRVVGLDVLNSVIVGIVAVDAIATEEASFLPAGLVLSLLAFLATVAFAYYLRRRPQDD